MRAEWPVPSWNFRANRSDRTYGRVWRDVLEEGFSCGLHRIERLMASPNQQGKITSAPARTTLTLDR